MELYLLYALFLYLLSILLAFAQNRTELKLAEPASRLSYLGGSAVASVLLAASVRDQGSGWTLGFFSGSLIAIVLISAVYLVSRCFGKFALAPAVFSAASLFIGAMAVLRARSGTVAGGPVEGAVEWERYAASHVICMFIALAGFTLSFIFSTMFLAQDRLLKRRSAGPLFAALPSLELTSRLNFAFITVGTAALAMGVFGGTAALGGRSSWDTVVRDPSILLSVLMLLLYTGLVVLRKGALERARTVSVVSIVFYFLLMFVFWGAHAGERAAGR